MEDNNVDAHLETKTIDAECVLYSYALDALRINGLIGFTYLMDKVLFKRILHPLAYFALSLIQSFISMLRAKNQEGDEDSNELKTNQIFHLKDLPSISQKYFKLIISISLPVSRFNHQQALLT